MGVVDKTTSEQHIHNSCHYFECGKYLEATLQSHRVLQQLGRWKTAKILKFENLLDIKALLHLSSVQYHHNNANVFQVVYLMEIKL